MGFLITPVISATQQIIQGLYTILLFSSSVFASRSFEVEGPWCKDRSSTRNGLFVAFPSVGATCLDILHGGFFRYLELHSIIKRPGLPQWIAFDVTGDSVPLSFLLSSALPPHRMIYKCPDLLNPVFDRVAHNSFRIFAEVQWR
jgi:hypothetical protein